MNKSERVALLLKKYSTISKAEVQPYDICPTRIPELNALLPGGFPRGKVCLTYGSPASGKSTTAVQVIADMQKTDPNHVTLLIPSERGDDLKYYADLGLSLDDGRTLIMKKKHYILEEVLEEVQNILNDPDAGGTLVDSILIDSWDGLIGYKEMFTPDGKEKEATKDSVAVKAAGAAKMWKRIKGLIADQNILFLIIAQVRTKGLGGYIVTEGYTGGFALAHNVDVVVAQNLKGLVREKVDGRDTIVGQTVKITLEKTKVNANAHKSAEVIYRYGKAWDQVEGIWNIAVALNLIQKTGGWYEYVGFPANATGVRKVQGEANAKAFFEENPEELDALNKLVSYIETNAPVTEEDIKRVYDSLVQHEETPEQQFAIEEETLDEPTQTEQQTEVRKRRGRPANKAQ